MKIAVLGAGNAGTALAAALSRNGHEVTLVKTSRAAHEEEFAFLAACGGRVTLTENGAQTTAAIACVTRELSCVRGKDLIVFCVRSDHHEDLILRVAPFLSDGQLLLFIPGYLSTAYVLKHCQRDVTVAEAQSAFLDCRLTAPGEIAVGFRNVRDPVGVFPAERKADAAAVLDQMGFPLTYCRSVLEAALHNPNMIVHPVGALLSLPRIESGDRDFCLYHEAFTPSVWRVLEALDAEKRAVLSALGLPPVSYTAACKYRNTLDGTADGKRVFFDYAAMPVRAKGPFSAEHRYLTEDVPQGLALLESLGGLLGVPTPVCTSLIALASAALGRDLRSDARTVEGLGPDNVARIVSELTDSKKAGSSRFFVG
ncbi:MAG: NAD/NADP octopine/nopaline dehydrogenase family protein [Clostridia bacterium]|nr:NAD/NADP octopine/nopaline dehydrogenase family protein [Clostridia bacterium]